MQEERERETERQRERERLKKRFPFATQFWPRRQTKLEFTKSSKLFSKYYLSNNYF
jgi:hypothetical protein